MVKLTFRFNRAISVLACNDSSSIKFAPLKKKIFFEILNRLKNILKVCEAQRHWTIFKEMAREIT